MPDLINIHHLPTYTHEKRDFPKGIIHDVPRMLAHVALSSDRQRRALNAHMTWLGHEGGIANAANLIKHASAMPVFPDAIEKDPESDEAQDNGNAHQDKGEGLWLFASRFDTMHLAGSLLVKKGVSIIDDKGQTVIDNGVLVEAVTMSGQEHLLANFYKKGIDVANSKADQGQIVFSIETAEPESEKQSRIKKWISGGLEYKDEIPMSVYRNYSFKEKINARRSDFRNKKPVPALIYTNQPLNLTTSN